MQCVSYTSQHVWLKVAEYRYLKIATSGCTLWKTYHSFFCHNSPANVHTSIKFHACFSQPIRLHINANTVWQLQQSVQHFGMLLLHLDLFVPRLKSGRQCAALTTRTYPKQKCNSNLNAIASSYHHLKLIGSPLLAKQPYRHQHLRSGKCHIDSRPPLYKCHIDSRPAAAQCCAITAQEGPSCASLASCCT